MLKIENIKIGDIVVAIKDFELVFGGILLTKGKKYTVLNKEDKYNFLIFVRTDKNEEHYFHFSYFEKRYRTLIDYL